MSSERLSKSSLMAWRQCPKRLWLQVYHPELVSADNQDDQKFLIGNEVGEFARSLYPEGILIEGEIATAVAATAAAMEASPQRAIFEAAYVCDDLTVRADLLLPSNSGYRLVEVKSGTGIKPHYLDDCAIQAWVLVQNKVNLAAVELAYINTDFVYTGSANYDGNLIYQPLDRDLGPLINEVPGWLESARQVLVGNEPDIPTGPKCESPYACSFRSYCSNYEGAAESVEFPLEVLYRMRASSRAELKAQGYEDAQDVPESVLNEQQRRIQRVCRTGKPELLAGAQGQLAELPYPRYYLDFETIAFAIPRWVGSSPYRSQIPFQWSCHVESATGALRHVGFLDTSGDDPRRAFAETLIRALGTTGPVFVYNQSFEKSRIAELAAQFPDLAPTLNSINARVVDLLPIARDHYYHPAMKGSWSIKAVLPTIAPDLDYHRLLVGNGNDAQAAYLEITHARTSASRRSELEEGLEAYCALDTLAMVRLAWFLQGERVYRFFQEPAGRAWQAAVDGASKDPERYDEALEVIVEYGRMQAGSVIIRPVSLLQRRLRVSYQHALALCQRLEDTGVLQALDLSVLSVSKNEHAK